MMEITAIVALTDRYYNALYTCDGDVVKDVFDPSAHVRGYYEGELINQNIPQYLKLLAALSSPEMIDEQVNAQIVSISLEGNTAVVKVTYYFESLDYTDFLSLLKINGQWQIVQKLFHHEQRQN